MSSPAPASDRIGLVWFRRDLRLDDNPAWAAATAEHDAVVALFVLDPALVASGDARRTARLFGDLAALDAELSARGGRLRIRSGDARRVIAETARELGADAVHVNLDVSPVAVRRDAVVEASLASAGVRWAPRWGTLVHRPGAVRTAAGGLSQVFTPFHKVWARTPLDPWPTPGGATILDGVDEPLPISSLPYPVLDGQVDEAAMPGERGAMSRLLLAAARADSYDDERNTPSVIGTSALSIDLKFGTLSPRTVGDVVGDGSAGRAALVRQLAWRDWYAHLLLATPALVSSPMKPQFAALRWRSDDEGFARWVEGRTGFPFVDAGMRQLAATGWMHNRVRMVTASFLVKNLLVDWRLGERHFRRVLLDGDTSQNVGNWQWTAGTGPDASPYNRIFNPVLQGQRFDADGAYIRRWVPELAGLDASAIHEPWAAGPLELAAAGVTLGDTYPFPILDLSESRQRALAAYGEVRAN